MIDVKKVIEEAQVNSYTLAIPIEEVTMEELIELGEAAWRKNINIRIKAEHSNLHQGVVVEVQRKWSTVEEEIRNDLKGDISDIFKAINKLKNGFNTLGL